MNHYRCSVPLAALTALVIASSTLAVHAQAPATAPAPTQAAPAGSAAPQGPVLVTRLAGDLNTKSAKVGDAVAAKVEKTLKLKDLEILKGSKVTGKVVSVESMQAGGGTASLGIEFDKVELKGGQVMPVAGLVVAVGQVGGPTGLGYDGIMGRGGVGSSAGMDPSVGGGHGHTDDIPMGSSLPGVAMGKSLDASGATQFRGLKTDIKMDSSTMVKIELFRKAS